MEDKKVKKIIIIVMLISILLLGLTGIVSAQENIIKIGVAVSLTGKIAYEGRLVKDGYEVWEDWVNSHGGITAGGINYKVKMVYYDDESTPVRGAKLTEMLITQNKVDFLFGPFSSAITFATTAIGEKYKMITIAPEANAVNIYERGYKYVFSVLPPAPMLMVPIAYMAENLNPKPKTVAIISANGLFPLSCAGGFRDKCKELGFDVVLFEKYPAGATDISTLLTQVKNLNPDILGVAGYTADSLMVIRQCKELNINPKIYAFSVGVMIPSFIAELGADAEYAFEGEWWLPGMKNSDKVFGTTADYVQACKDKFGPDYMPEYHVSSASAAGTLLQLAIEKADSIETEKVREALSTLDLELATWPAIAFNEKGQNIKWPHPVVQVQNGKYVIVYPESSQENAPMYPAPEWKER
ncbi:MAG: branched-chain amino acid ABC transporter substrate-binding protein [Candidatus Infernicultor aquiphilus]|uniref:Branched-chain amino acid ABC transporter substrate-binding protein n=1 Tax=Candidatus Infernicultor aquiphilus TaxID=1805029 RepID=A0A2M7K5A9_9BACT|nr:MAG: branched-chain amino acid ABC transporter substrate-binding protein [Candidatus Atribacteria bacterium CG_4_8_14_3_um_filter_34_18]